MTDERTRLAIPSSGSGGFDAQRSGHFGRCDCFTMADVVDGKVIGVTVVDNPPHEDGGCLAPVNLLASNGASALLVGGIGARPLAGFQDAGIDVYFDNKIPIVRDAIAAFLDGEIEIIDASGVCGGQH